MLKYVKHFATKIHNVSTSHGGPKEFLNIFVCNMKIVRKWIMIAFIVMRDQEVMGVEIDYHDDYLLFHAFAIY